MPARITPADIEEMRRVADECDYAREAIARRMYASVGTVTNWGVRGYLTRNGDTLRQAAAKRYVERVTALAVQHHGDIRAIAAELGGSHEQARQMLNRRGLTKADRDALARPRRCIECGAEFQSANMRKLLCSVDCKHARHARKTAHKTAIRAGRDPYEPRGRDLLERRYRDALWRTFGHVARTAQILGCSASNAWASINRWGLRGYLERCRASQFSEERLTEIIHDAGWDVRKACRAHSKSTGWFRKAATRAGALHLVTHAPCLRCGRMCPRVQLKGKRTFCSVACRNRTAAEYSRQRYAARQAATGKTVRRQKTCISSSPSSAASAATPK
jgi:hypothetical protein